MSTPDPQPIFYYDLGSPECYLMAETIMAALPVVPEWEPVLARQLGGLAPGREREAIERLAAQHGLLALRWPRSWPPDTRGAMLAATYAKRAGRAVAFSLAAFRQAFAGGRDLGDQDTVLLAGAACELHPAAVLKGSGLRSVREALDRAVARAAGAGVRTLPAIEIAGQVFTGEDAVARAALALGGASVDLRGPQHAAAGPGLDGADKPQLAAAPGGAPA
ncbi:MAG: DsbA family protein [Solirubrobacteraceae bacterium]